MNKLIAVATTMIAMFSLLAAICFAVESDKSFSVTSHYTQDHRVFTLTAKHNVEVTQIDFNGGCGSIVFENTMVFSEGEIMTFDRVCTRVDSELLVAVKNGNEIQLYR